jgi:hypothetical protein
MFDASTIIIGPFKYTKFLLRFKLGIEPCAINHNVPAVCGVPVPDDRSRLFLSLKKLSAAYIFAQAEGRRGFINPEKLARLLPYLQSG